MIKYPASKRGDDVDTLHGTKVPDPYRWLEDEKSPEVQKWMAAQDGLTRGYLSELPGREALKARLKEVYYVDAISPPRRFGDRYFYSRQHKDKEKAVLYWKEGDAGKEKVLIDPNLLSADGSTSLGTTAPSWDGKKLAYGLKANNSDETVLYVRDVASGKDSQVDVIPGAKYASPSWRPENDGFFYTWVPPVSGTVTPAARPAFQELRYHKLGSDPATDAVVRQRTGDPQMFLGGFISKDGHWLFATIDHGWNSSDLYFRDARKVDQPWKPLIVGKPALYSVDVYKDSFYITTNEGAPRFRVFRADPNAPARDKWREIIPERRGTVIESASVLGGRLLLRTLRDASSHLEIRELDGKLVRELVLPGLGAIGSMAGDEDQDDAYFNFSSFTTPPQIYKTSMTKGGTDLWAEVKVPADLSSYEVEQVRYPSNDGTKISMFVVHKRGMKKDGSTPFLLTGYGGFQVAMQPSFSTAIIPWLEAGGGYALPNLRGGGEYGEEWHRAGMREHKQNVFDDFARAAAFLVDIGYTQANRLAIRGGSNGGLLMGAAVTQHPELFGAVICAVPLLDMIRYPLFGSGATWVPEYGSPSKANEFKWLYAYSPYHHVKDGAHYPPLLMLSADSDDRVDPMHARKMIASLQAVQTSLGDAGKPALMRIEKHSGHGGADLVKQAVEMSTDVYAFLFAQFGMKLPTPAPAGK